MRNKNAKVSDPNSFVSDPGSSEHIVYSARINENNVIEVIPSGKKDWQAYIESFRESTDMAYILKQLSLGDASVLNQTAAQYGDFTLMPHNMLEAMQMQLDAERHFDALPLDIKAKFNNNYREWCAAAGTDDWLAKMNIKVDVPDDINKEGVSDTVTE